MKPTVTFKVKNSKHSPQRDDETGLWEILAAEEITDWKKGDIRSIDTGVTLELPKGYIGKIIDADVCYCSKAIEKYVFSEHLYVEMQCGYTNYPIHEGNTLCYLGLEKVEQCNGFVEVED